MIDDGPFVETGIGEVGDGASAVVRLWVAGRRSGRGHCRAARLGLQFFHLPQGAVAIEAIGRLALGSTGG
jgi:hypothetical protein